MKAGSSMQGSLDVTAAESAGWQLQLPCSPFPHPPLRPPIPSPCPSPGPHPAPALLPQSRVLEGITHVRQVVKDLIAVQLDAGGDGFCVVPRLKRHRARRAGQARPADL